MKKIMLLTISALMILTMFAGCFSNPVADDIDNYVNVQMKDINANYDQLKTDYAHINQIKSNQEFIELIEKKMLVTINDSLDKLSKMELKTDEVRQIKDKYVKVMEKYKEAFEDYLAAAKANDVKATEAANAKVEEAVGLLDGYNKALETLAKENGMKIEY